MFNAPFSNTRSVVELAIAEMISLTRRLTEKNRSLHSGTWEKSASGAHEMRGRRLGIVGYGNIGSQLSVLAEALGMSVVFYDTAREAGAGQRPQLRVARRAAGDRRRGHPARRRTGRQRRAVRGRPVRADAPRRGVPEPVPGFRRRPPRARRAHHQRPPRRCRHRRLPGRAEPGGRPVRLGPARAAQRHPHPAHRRLDRGGPAGHRWLRRRQAARLRQCRQHHAQRQPAPDLAGPAARRRTGSPTCTTTHRACSPR